MLLFEFSRACRLNDAISCHAGIQTKFIKLQGHRIKLSNVMTKQRWWKKFPFLKSAFKWKKACFKPYIYLTYLESPCDYTLLLHARQCVIVLYKNWALYIVHVPLTHNWLYTVHPVILTIWPSYFSTYCSYSKN